MSKVLVGINGMGRIGRSVARLLTTTNLPHLDLVAVNDLAGIATISHLLKYDSVHGKYPHEITVSKGAIHMNGYRVQMINESNPENIPWDELGVDIVLECTGNFKTSEEARRHITAGAKKVVISAPSPSAAVKTVVLGINDWVLDNDWDLVSNASCTTNCTAPLVKLLDELCGIESGYITTVHSYTTDQSLHDAPHSDLRRARAGAYSIIPTTTGAAKAITKIFPHLDGKMGGCGIRVPVPNGSLTDFSCTVRNPVSVDEINSVFKQAAAKSLAGILEYMEDPIVSIDVIGNPHSCIFDSQLTSVIGNMVKVVGWYDNEAGYSNRLVELIGKM